MDADVFVNIVVGVVVDMVFGNCSVSHVDVETLGGMGHESTKANHAVSSMDIMVDCDMDDRVKHRNDSVDMVQ